MRNFTLKVLRDKETDDNNIKTYEALIVSFDNSKFFSQPYSTFNEKLVEKENDQFELNFSIAGYVTDHHYNPSTKTIETKNYPNHWLDIIKLGSHLILTLDEIKVVKLIVSSVTPRPSKENIVFDFVAQDEVSYQWTKRNLGYSYTNLEGVNLGVKNIYEIVNTVLRDNWLDNTWICRNTEGEKEHPENALSNKKISLEVLDSNPYNVIIEACNTLGCYMKVNYEEYYITFYQKNDIPFSGYRYRPEINLSSFSNSYNIDEYASLLHVVGGENEYGEIITLVPAMPLELLNFLTNPVNTSLWELKGTDLWEKIFIRLPLTPRRFEIYDRIGSPLRNTNSGEFETTDDGLIKYGYNGVWLYSEELPVYDDNGNEMNYEHRRKSIVLEDAGKNIEDFLIIARKTPHLGQFLLDFTYFEKAGLLTQKKKAELDDLFNTQMRNNNIYLKYYVSERYRLQTIIDDNIDYITNIATDFYGAELETKLDESDPTQYSVSYRTNGETEATKYIEQITSFINADFINNLVFLHGKLDFGLYPEFKNIIEQIKYYLDKLEEAQKTYNTLNTENYQAKALELEEAEKDETSSEEYLKSLRDQVLPTKSELTLLSDQIQSYYKLINGANFDNDGNLKIDNNLILGSYVCLYKILNDKWSSFSLGSTQSSSLDEQISIYENRNKDLWANIYHNYGNYIYEIKYENSDELNSLSLYNQGIIYFEKQRRPVASYSIGTIDIGTLELIGLPRLAIGSKIRVYNDKLNLLDNEEDIISFNNNELIITQLTYDLRNPLKVDVSVEQVQPYNTIVSKLLQSIRL